jgi:hypothetical protein
MLKITPSWNTDQGVQRMCKSLKSNTFKGVRKLKEVGFPLKLPYGPKTQIVRGGTETHEVRRASGAFSSELTRLTSLIDHSHLTRFDPRTTDEQEGATAPSLATGCFHHPAGRTRRSVGNHRASRRHHSRQSVGGMSRVSRSMPLTVVRRCTSAR